MHAPDVETKVRLLLLAPVLEEWVMRAGLQHYLIDQFRQSRCAAKLLPILGSTAIFSILHLAGGWMVVASVFVPGFFLATLYQLTLDWRLCAVTHAVFNGMALTVCMQ